MVGMEWKNDRKSAIGGIAGVNWVYGKYGVLRKLWLLTSLLGGWPTGQKLASMK